LFTVMPLTGKPRPVSIPGHERLPKLYTKPRAGHWFPGERRRGGRVRDGYVLLQSAEFRDLAAISVETACHMDLLEKARELGIQTAFIDGQGRERVTGAEALRIIIDALPVRPQRRFLSETVVIRSGQPARTVLNEATALPLHWKIMAGPELIAQGETDAAIIDWPTDLPEGTYALHLVDAAALTEESPLIVAPARAFGGDFDRGWLLAVQLYGIRSARNWGIGDFTDLERLIEFAHRLGADGVGLNPLHVLFDDRPGDCSPYSPNSRLFLNALYVDVEKLPGFEPGAFAAFSAAREAVRQGDIVDYVAVAGLKWQALRAAFGRFKAAPDPAHRREFDRFRAARAPLLSRFACFEVLRHRFKTPWWEWPAEWRSPDDTHCAGLRQGADRDDIEFVEFVQWSADRQLEACQAHAARLGMKVGLYLDVAVGSSPTASMPGTSRWRFRATSRWGRRPTS
jgi:4-alpha-glucanotransferase